MLAVFLLCFYLGHSVFISDIAAAGLIIPAGSSFILNASSATVPGNVINAGTLSFTTGSLSLSGNFENTGIFISGSGLVSFTSSSPSEITGESSFFNLSVDTALDGAKTIKFGAGQTQTITGTLTLLGHKDKVLTIESTSDGTQGIIAIPSSIDASADYIDVKDNLVAEPNTITVGPKSTDVSNNIRWIFTPMSLSVNLDNDAIDFGSLACGSAATNSNSTPVALSNTGNVPITLVVSATPVDGLVLDNIAGHDQIVIRFQVKTFGNLAAYDETMLLLSDPVQCTGSNFGGHGINLQIGDIRDLGVELTPPLTASSSAARHITITITCVEGY